MKKKMRERKKKLGHLRLDNCLRILIKTIFILINKLIRKKDFVDSF